MAFLVTVLFNITILTQQFLSRNPLDLIFNAGLIAKIVLAILLLFSVISWGIILDKWRVFRKLNRESDKFLELFKERKSVREIYQASKKLQQNPFAAVFKEAYWMLSRNEEDESPGFGGQSGIGQMMNGAGHHSAADLVRVFDSVASREVLNLEKHLTFLATTGSVSPFFGLFGTVWGVMSAFLTIGFTGSADLSVVAPGIAEALITTVAGLGAAIPAVMSYNYFVSKLKRLSSELEIFYSNLIEAFARKEAHEVR